MMQTRTGGALWQRILRRHAGIRPLVRPRVPLVLLRRPRARGPAAASPAATHVHPLTLALHVQVAWPPLPDVHDLYRHLLTHTTERVIARSPRTPHVPPAGVFPVRHNASSTHRSARTPFATLHERVPSEPRGSVLASPRLSSAAVHPRRLRQIAPAAPIGRRPTSPAWLPRSVVTRSEAPRTISAPIPHALSVAGALAAGRSAVPYAAHAPLLRSIVRHQQMNEHSTSPASPAPSGLDRVTLRSVRRSSADAAVAPTMPSMYSAPATRTLAVQPRAAAHEAVAPAVSIAHPVAPPQPPIDVRRLSEDVYHHIQRRIRIDRERRGA